MGHRKGLLKVRVGGGVNVTYAPDASFCEINTGALYALEAIQLEIEQLSQRDARHDDSLLSRIVFFD